MNNERAGLTDLKWGNEPRYNVLSNPDRKEQFETLPPLVEENAERSYTEPLLQESRFQYGSIDSFSSSEDDNPEIIKLKKEKRAARRLLLSTNGVMLIISIMALDVLREQWWLTGLISLVAIFSVFSICEVLLLKSRKQKQPRYDDFEINENGTLAVRGVLTRALILLLILHAVIMSIFTVFQVSEVTFAGDNIRHTAESRCSDWYLLENVGETFSWHNAEECVDVILKQLKWEISGCSFVCVVFIATLSWQLSKLRVTLFYNTDREI